jgi:hypothetical protein
MKQKFIHKSLCICLLCICWVIQPAKAQLTNSGKISGNFQLDAQYYQADSLIGAPEVKEQMLMNAFANVIYTNNNFTAGVRYEIYQNPMLGFDSRYKGSGVPYRFATYTKDDWNITVGNFYEQFGNGLIFRTYEERNLGYDNAMDGIRVVVSPYKGVTIKGIWGNQRFFFEKGKGIVRGIDGEINFNEFCSKLSDSPFRLTLGGSFVSKYQEDQDPQYILPENVGSYAARMTLGYKKFNFNAEYAYKINDPSTVNNLIYKPGDALYVSASYSQKGLGILLNGLKVDNMDYRSDRTVTGNPLLINYLPALTRQHIYTLSAFYPYGTQTTGQIGYQGQINYKVKKNTVFGGKYGMDLALNYSNIHAIDKTALNDTTAIGQSGTDGYKSDFISWGKEKFFTDVNLEITKKLSPKLKLIFNYVYFEYNKAVIEGHSGEPMVYAHIGIADLSYKINEKNSIRFELQHLATKQDKKNWALMLVEYSIAPKWFFTVSDMYNYENEDLDKRIHYYSGAITFVKGTTRLALGYGKQRQGIVCVGGVCRQVPASNGLSLTLVSSF